MQSRSETGSPSPAPGSPPGRAAAPAPPSRADRWGPLGIIASIVVATVAVLGFMQHQTDKIVELHAGLDLRIDNLNARFDAQTASFDAKLDRLRADISARIDGVENRLSTRIDGVENKLSTRIDKVENKLSARIDAVENKLSTRIDAVETKLSTRIDRLETKMDAEFKGVRGEIADVRERASAIETRLDGLSDLPERVAILEDEAERPGE